MKKYISIAIFWLVPLCGYTQEQFTLAEAIQYAIDNNDQIKMDELDVDRAKAQITEYKSIGIPKVTANLDYKYYFKVPAQPTQDFLTPAVYGILEEEGLAEPYTGTPETFNFSFFQRNNVTANIMASAIVFDGSYLAGLKAAKLYKDLERKKIVVTEQEVKANVTRAYANVLIAYETKEMLQKNIENLNEILFETEEIYKSGFVEKLDVSRIKLSLETLQTELDNVNSLIELANNLLKFQMDYPLQKDIQLTEDLELLVDILKVSDIELSEELDYSQRAEIEQFNTSIMLNELNVDRINKKRLPSLFAFTDYTQSLQRNNLFDSDQAGFFPGSSIGLSLTIPIYDGGERIGQLQQAKIDLEKLEINYDQFNKGTQMQLMNARIDFAKSKKNLLSRERVLDLSEEIYETTNIKYKEGVGSSLELSQSETDLYTAQLNYVNALYDLLSSKIEIDIASGKL